MSEQPEDFDDGVVDGVDPGDALTPGADTDVEHAPEPVEPGHPDYVPAAAVPLAEDAGGAHL